MPRGMHKSNTLRKVAVKVPGGRTSVQFKTRNPSPAVCATCKKPLAGVPRKTPTQLKKLAKSSRRPERPYGGKLCSACMRKEMQQKAREMTI